MVEQQGCGPLFLVLIPAGVVGALQLGLAPGAALIVGLAVFAVVFAINSAVHSYLVLAYSDADSVSVDVGFYYMANAAGPAAGDTDVGRAF